MFIKFILLPDRGVTSLGNFICVSTLCTLLFVVKTIFLYVNKKSFLEIEDGMFTKYVVLEIPLSSKSLQSDPRERAIR